MRNTTNKPKIISFTPTEKEILNHYLRGMTAKEIAQNLSRSFRTIEEHINNIKNKLQAQHRSEVFTKIRERYSPVARIEVIEIL